MNLAESCHFVNLLPPVDTQGGKVTDIFSFEGWSHATIIIQCGATDSDAGNITVQKTTGFTDTTGVDFAFRYYAEETDSGDVLDGTPTTVTAATGIDVSANDNTMYVIEIDDSEFGVGYPCCQVTFSAPGGANLMSCIAILSGGRSAKAASPTVLA